MRTRELILLEFTQLLNLLCTFRDRSPCEITSVAKAFDSLITDAEQVGVPRKELCDYVYSKWLAQRGSEAKARSVADSVFSRLKAI